MKILSIHNKYKFRGSEDESRESEGSMLMAGAAQTDRLSLIIRRFNETLYARGSRRCGVEASYRMVRKRILECKPDVVDIHGFFPLASPRRPLSAARSLGKPVIQTLHNYRLLCPGATFYRNGTTCEDCTRHLIPWPAAPFLLSLQRAADTSSVAAMIALHRLLRMWKRTVLRRSSRFQRFEKRKFVENGFPASRIVVKTKFRPGSRSPPGQGGGLSVRQPALRRGKASGRC